GKTQGGGVAVYGGTLFIKGGVVENNLAETIGPDMYISSINSSDYGTVRINAGRIGSESTPSSVYVCEFAQLIVSSNYAINDQVILEENAYIRVDGTINATNKILIIPERYPGSKTDDIKVVEFASALTPAVNKFDIDVNVKDQFRLKVVGNDIVISEAYFKLTLNANGGDITALETLTEDYVKDGNNLIVDAKYNTNINDILLKVKAERENRDHIDWDTQVDGLDEDFDLNNPNLMPYTDLILYVIWSGEHHLLTIIQNDSTGSTDVQFSGDISYIDNSGYLTKKVFTDVGQTTNGKTALSYFASNITREGYTFVGFCANQNGEGVVYDATGTGFAMPNTDVILYAIWQANTYTINYNANKPATASKNIENEVDSTVCTFDEYAFISSTTFILEGWTQINWNTKQDGTGTSYKLNDKVLNLLSEEGAELELYAIWKANNYTVIYVGNKPSTASTQLTGVVSNTTHTYDTASALNTAQKFALIGYIQTSWNTQSDGQGRSIGLNEQVTDLVDQGTINLYAIWRPVSYTVAYNACNGEDDPVGTSSFNYDTKYNLKTQGALGFEKPYHNFMGWATLPGSDEVVYEDGAEILNLTDKEEVVSLYAVWKVYTATIYGEDEQLVEIAANPANGQVTISKQQLATNLQYLGYEIGYLSTTPTTSGIRNDF
ncbi:MAG: InlB B-repeat-containing protein, partial [Clostridia bacterium]|nr:InlB B-repeat-containing protein [Clostridia bacterium]